MVRFTEKRRESRKYHKAPVLVQELNDIYIYNGRMVNYNYQGVYFESDTAFEAGTNIILGIEGSTYISPSASPDSPNFYHAIILWHTRLTGSMLNFGYGTKFVYFNDKQKLPKADYILMEENRKHSRKLSLKPVIVFSNNKHRKGLITNIGRRGAFIETLGKYKAGQIIELLIPGPKVEESKRLKAEVVHLNQSGVGIIFKSIYKKKPKKKSSAD